VPPDTYNGGKVLAAVAGIRSDISELKVQVTEVKVAITGDLHGAGLRDRLANVERDFYNHKGKPAHSTAPSRLSSTDETTSPGMRAASDTVELARWKVIGSIGLGLIGVMSALAAGLLTLLK